MAILNKNSRIILECERSIAYDSPDHIVPVGTRVDNSSNPRFNSKIYRLYGNIVNQMSVLDLGCSGGAFVRECLSDGCFAIGLEGSDYSQIYERSEWNIIPKFLFTGDITYPFNFYLNNKKNKISFQVITAWEVMEHIHPDKIKMVCENVKNHLSDDGIFIASICPDPDVRDGVVLHQTVENKQWWIRKFAEHGLYYSPKLERYFNGHYIRGNYQGDTSFNIVLTNQKNKFPRVPRESIMQRLADVYFRSKMYKLLRYMVGF